jgi:hypothetical protein
MKTLKIIIFGTLAGLFGFSIFYLAGAFWNCSFDQCVWEETSKNVVTCFGVCAFIAMFIFVAVLTYESEYKKS